MADDVNRLEHHLSEFGREDVVICSGWKVGKQEIGMRRTKKNRGQVRNLRLAEQPTPLCRRDGEVNCKHYLPFRHFASSISIRRHRMLSLSSDPYYCQAILFTTSCT